MGYGGKVKEQLRARELRAQSWTLQDIATELGVSKSSVSLWVRDVDFVPNPHRIRHTGPRKPSSLHVRKLAEIERCAAEGLEVIGGLSQRELLLTGLTLYLGEGFKRDSGVGMANTDPRVLLYFVTWLRACFEIDESRLRVRIYLHENLDLEAAEQFWSGYLGIPRTQFTRPYRAVADATRRISKHQYGCPSVRLSSSTLHRRIMGMIDALVTLPLPSGVAQLAEHRPVKPIVVGSSPTPGAT